MLSLNPHQAHLQILLTIFAAKHVVILACWCVSKIISFSFLRAILTLFSTDDHLEHELTRNDELH